MEENVSKHIWLPRFRLIAKHLTPHKRELVIMSLLGVIAALTEGSVPFIIGRFLDALVGTVALPSFLRDFPSWSVFLFLFAVVQLTSGFFSWLIGRRAATLGNILHASMSANGYSHLLRLPLSFHKNHKPGEVTDTIRRSAINLSNFAENILIRLAPQFLSVVVGLSIGYLINPALTLVLAVGILAFSVLLSVVVRPLAGATRAGQELWSKASGYSHNVNSNVVAVKQAGSEEYERGRNWDVWVNGASAGWMKVEHVWKNISYFQNAIITATRLAVFLASVYFISRGELTIGGLVAFNGYAAMVFGPFATLGLNWATVENALSSVERAEHIYELPEEAYEQPGGANVTDVSSVEFADVRFSYKEGEPEVLKGVSFKAERGEVIVLVGKTGAGKSTIIDLLSGYYEPTAGEVRVSGIPTGRMNLKSLRSRIAVVPQEVALFNDTIRANIAYGSPGSSDAEIEEAAVKAHVDEFVERFPLKYDQEVGHRGVKLSVGQKQRVAIARAILRNPDILILDEPTSALDAETEKYITESFEELMRGRTTFIIAHRLSTVRRADKILFLEDGKIVEEGSHAKLMRKKGGKYRALYNLHVGLRE